MLISLNEDKSSLITIVGGSLTAITLALTLSSTFICPDCPSSEAVTVIEKLSDQNNLDLGYKKGFLNEI